MPCTIFLVTTAYTTTSNSNICHKKWLGAAVWASTLLIQAYIMGFKSGSSLIHYTWSILIWSAGSQNYAAVFICWVHETWMLPCHDAPPHPRQGYFGYDSMQVMALKLVPVMSIECQPGVYVHACSHKIYGTWIYCYIRSTTNVVCAGYLSSYNLREPAVGHSYRKWVEVNRNQPAEHKTRTIANHVVTRTI